MKYFESIKNVPFMDELYTEACKCSGDVCAYIPKGKLTRQHVMESLKHSEHAIWDSYVQKHMVDKEMALFALSKYDSQDVGPRQLKRALCHREVAEECIKRDHTVYIRFIEYFGDFLNDKDFKEFYAYERFKQTTNKKRKMEIL